MVKVNDELSVIAQGKTTFSYSLQRQLLFSSETAVRSNAMADHW
jgi:hypothetical protein